MSWVLTMSIDDDTIDRIHRDIEAKGGVAKLTEEEHQEIRARMERVRAKIRVEDATAKLQLAAAQAAQAVSHENLISAQAALERAQQRSRTFRRFVPAIVFVAIFGVPFAAYKACTAADRYQKEHRSPEEIAADAARQQRLEQQYKAHQLERRIIDDCVLQGQTRQWCEDALDILKKRATER